MCNSGVIHPGERDEKIEKAQMFFMGRIKRRFCGPPTGVIYSKGKYLNIESSSDHVNNERETISNLLDEFLHP